MSYETLSDQGIERAKQHVKDAVRALGEVVTGDTNGWDEYTNEYKERLTKTLAKLIEIRNELCE